MNYSFKKSQMNPFQKIEQQPIEESFCLYDGANTVGMQEGLVHDFSFSCAHQYELTMEENYVEQDVSQKEVQNYTISYTQITGMYGKYLNQDTSPLSKKINQSGRKAFTNKKSNIYSKKTMKNKKETSISQKQVNLDPMTQGLEGLQINRQQLLDTLRERISGGEQEKNAVFLQLGLKMPKSLGKGRADRDFQAILSFLEKGELCADYINDFLLMMQS